MTTGAICRSMLLTVTATLRQQGLEVWRFLKQAWVAHRLGGRSRRYCRITEQAIHNRRVESCHACERFMRWTHASLIADL
jgi:hypothetical protein